MPRCQLRVSDIAVTDSARFCGGGFDSFLGFDSVVLITLALHVFEYFLHLSYEPAFFAHFGFVRVTHCDSLLLAYPHVFLTCGTFLEFVGFFLLVRATVALASIATTIIAPILLLALRSTALLAVFLPNFAIFALVSVHLGKFNFSSLPSFGNSNAFLCQLSLPIHLYLSPLVLQFLSSVSQPILAAPS